MIHVIQLAGADNNDGNESDEEHQRPQYAKEVHRLDAEGGKEPKGYQVQVSVEETIPPAEFCLAKFPCLMVYDFLANLLETGILCPIGGIGMNLGVQFYLFYNIFAIGFQAAIEIVQVLYAGNLACRSVEQFCRYGL